MFEEIMVHKNENVLQNKRLRVLINKRFMRKNGRPLYLRNLCLHKHMFYEH